MNKSTIDDPIQLLECESQYLFGKFFPKDMAFFNNFIVISGLSKKQHKWPVE